MGTCENYNGYPGYPLLRYEYLKALDAWCEEEIGLGREEVWEGVLKDFWSIYNYTRSYVTQSAKETSEANRSVVAKDAVVSGAELIRLIAEPIRSNPPTVLGSLRVDGFNLR